MFRDTTTKHGRSEYRTDKPTVTQVDVSNWAVMKSFIKGLPERAPHLQAKTKDPARDYIPSRRNKRIALTSQRTAPQVAAIQTGIKTEPGIVEVHNILKTITSQLKKRN